MVKPVRKSILYVVAFLFLGTVGLLAVRYYFPLGMCSEAMYRDQSHDATLRHRTNAALDAALVSDFQIVAPELAKFGLHLAKPVEASCGEGDPSLYKYDCKASATVEKDTLAETLRAADNAVQLLRHFDTFMRSKGFDGGYRRQAGTYADAELAADITSQGVDIEYDKGLCSVDFFVSLSRPDYNVGYSGLKCSKTLLDGFYY